jgi:hypothetical protein
MPVNDLQAFELTSGSVAFVPSGWWHRTECLEPSISYTIRLALPTIGGLLSRGLDHTLMRLPRWRAPVPCLGSRQYRAETEKIVEEALSALRDDIQNCTARDVLEGQLGAFYERQEARVFQLTDDPAQPGRIIVRVEGESDDDDVVEIEVEQELTPVLQWIAAQQGGFYEADVKGKYPTLRDGDWVAVFEVALESGLLTRRPIARV